MTVGRYIQMEKQDDIALSFDSYEIQHALHQDVSPTPQIVLDIMAEPVFSLGRASTGADFHRHDENWIAQVMGRKMWFTAERNTQGLDQLHGQSPCSFRQATEQIPSTCVARPGELLYLPESWYHATCNLDDVTIGVGGRGHTTAVHRACQECSTIDLRHALTSISAALLDSHGRSPLFICSAAGCAEGVEMLMSSDGVDLEASVDFLNGGQAIHVAAKNGHVPVIQALANRSVSLVAKDNAGMGPIHLAAFGGHEMVVKRLLSEHVSLESMDSNGKQPLHWAAMLGHVRLVETLTDLNSDLSARNDQGSQPLHFAAHKGHEAVVELLAKLKANVNAADNRELKPLHWAELGGHASMSKLLIGFGASKLQVKREL